MWLRRRVEDEPDPSSLEDAARWLEKHTESAAASALDTEERWVFKHRSKFGRYVESIVFPFPHEIADATDADGWAQAAERFAAERTVTGDMQKSYFWLLMAILMAGLVGAIASAAWEIASFFALLSLGCLTFLRALGQGAFRLAPTWERRALAFRRRAELLRSSDGGSSCGQERRPSWKWFKKR